MTGGSRNAAAEAVEVSARHKAGSAGAQDAWSETRSMIRLSDIRVHGMDISIPNERQTRVYSTMAGSAAGRRGLPPVRVGYWVGGAAGIADGGGAAAGAAAGGKSGGGGKAGRAAGSRDGNAVEITEYEPPFYYLMADADVYRGCLRGGSGTDKIECIVVKCETESDFLARHALANQRHTSYDPLKLGQVVRWMQAVSRGGGASDGTGRTITRMEAEGARRAVEDVMRACRDTVDQRFITLHLDGEAADIISEMCAWLGSKLSRFELPFYIPYQVSRAPAGVQVELAEQISLIVRGGSVIDAKFAWPAPEEISALADTPTFRGEPAAAAALSDKSRGGRGVTVAVPKNEGGGGGGWRRNQL